MASEADTALVAAVAAVVVALISLGGSVWTQRKAAAAAVEQGRLGRELETLKSRLTIENDTAKARRDYEYEARKRLYAELYPLAFQLNEAAVAACNRVRNLARAARDGHLARDRTSWLDDPADTYYFNSTLYSLLAPLAIHELMSRRLTLFDLNLDPHLQLQRFFAKRAYQALRSDFDLVDPRYPSLMLDPSQPDRRYQPPDAEGPAPSAVEERWLWRQGVYSGRVGQAVDALLVTEGMDATGQRRGRVMSYAEFAKRLGSEDLRSNATSSMGRALRPFVDVLRGFHPLRRPVTWRIVLAQVCCYRMILTLPTGDLPLDSLLPAAGLTDEAERSKYSPLGEDAAAIMAEIGIDRPAMEVEIAAAFETGNAYLRESVEQFGRDYPMAIPVQPTPSS